MIRANLLPRRRETFSAAGVEINLDLLRASALALAVVACVALIGIAIEEFRLHRLDDAATAREAVVTAHAPMREESRRLMLEVARYQEFEREAAAYRGSGTDAALAVVRIGNSLPSNVWVNEVTRVGDGYSIVGGSRSVDSLAGAVAALGHASEGARASLVSIDNRAASSEGVRFTARLAQESPAPATAAMPAGMMR